jgi:hypothetical protein
MPENTYLKLSIGFLIDQRKAYKRKEFVGFGDRRLV